MKLKKLFAGIDFLIFGDENVNIKNLAHNSKDVKQKCLFFCLKGRTHSGFDYVNDAIKNGAEAIVVDKGTYKSYKTLIDGLNESIVVVENVRSIVSHVCHNFYNGSKFNFKLIGITGTNGKTTISNIIANGLINAGYSVCVIGTSGVFINGDALKGEELTTPDPIDLYNIFEFINKIYVDYCIMEVSAHALDLNKVDSLCFEYGIFTNLTEDHLDYFVNMENYYQAKKKFFKLVKNAIINIDDEYGKLYYKEFSKNKISYGKTSLENKIIYNNKYFKDCVKWKKSETILSTT